MTRLRAVLRRFGSALAFASALLLTGTLWIASTHHHTGAAEHSCPVCANAHAPAIMDAGATGVSAPSLLARQVRGHVALAPRVIARAFAPSRAPPLA